MLPKARRKQRARTESHDCQLLPFGGVKLNRGAPKGDIVLWCVESEHFFFSHTCANKPEFRKFKSSSTGVAVAVEAVEGGRRQSREQRLDVHKMKYGAPTLVYQPQHLGGHGCTPGLSWHQACSFSAKTVQNITDCYFNAPLWHLGGWRLFHQFLQPQQLVRWDLLLSHCVPRRATK